MVETQYPVKIDLTLNGCHRIPIYFNKPPKN